MAVYDCVVERRIQYHVTITSKEGIEDARYKACELIDESPEEYHGIPYDTECVECMKWDGDEDSWYER